jgi:hypothetical protein
MSNNLKELVTIELTEENIESLIYFIRGQKVMLDFDLARIYGYETKAFNQQVKNNIEKFDNDFMFKLTAEEVDAISRCKKSTSIKNVTESEQLTRSKKLTPIMQIKGMKGGRTSLPYAFTEQGIYMLMTVLKGELATKQSKALIRLFKKMKDYIVESNNLLNINGVIELTNKVERHEKEIKDVKKQLEVVMDNFIDPSTYKHFLIMNGEKLEAEIAFQVLYSLANKSIYIIDDYIDLRTLHLLKCVNKNIKITIFSDNVSRNNVSEEDIAQFEKEYGIGLEIKPTNNIIHDRYIMLDYDTPNEKLYHCGASSKDAGNKATTIVKIDDSGAYHPLIDALL